MPSCSHSSDLSTGEQRPQPFLFPTGSSCWHRAGAAEGAGIPICCWTLPCRVPEPWWDSPHWTR